jgi:putative hydrolase of HD superfamily
LLQNYQNQGGTWQLYGISEDQVMERMAPVQDGTPQLWALVEQIVADCIKAGYLQSARSLSTNSQVD